MKIAVLFKLPPKIKVILTALMLFIVLCCFQGQIFTATALPELKQTTKPYFLFFSDVHLGTSISTSNSSYKEDAGPDLWAAFQAKMTLIINGPTPPAFILYTGDLPEHTTSVPKRKEDINQMLKNLQQLATLKHIPLFYLPGNNDALTKDYGFFSDKENNTALSWMEHGALYPYEAFNIARDKVASGAYMLPNSNLSEGYYAAKIMNGLRIICLNSVIWSSEVINHKISFDDQVVAGNAEMDWLKLQLKAASSANDQVYIAMHIPPGIDIHKTNDKETVMMWTGPRDKPSWQSVFLKAVADYKNNISGVFFGHTHMDEFRLLYDSTQRETINQVAISAPAISPLFQNNPGFKLVSFDSQTKLPLDFTTYYTKPNPISWNPPYSFSDLTGLKQETPILTTLQNMKPKDREELLHAIYNVKNGDVANYKIGIDVR